ncbi:MAG: Uma2 family endonuclease [Chloroherpetonaceae bacterium]|nr:Uma2 family endonuclease [Chloroherpetonaceae bacterium]MDW8437224.1 Uma2 family endonuclease [Chloroherpetonaceae bacterium]
MTQSLAKPKRRAGKGREARKEGASFWTIEDLERLQRETKRNYDLIKGKLVEVMPAGDLHGYVASAINVIIGGFARENNLGATYAAETGFVVSRAPEKQTVMGADFAFISKERLPKQPKKKGFGEIAPDFVVEVQSPNDNLNDALTKVSEWLAGGVKLVWLVNPETETITTFNQKGEVKSFSGKQKITGEEVIKNFSIETRKFFE